MTGRSQARSVAILLLPALLVFTFQWAVEVFHPVEESRAAHEHGDGGTVVYDPTACEPNGHAPHFCSHSSAYARIIHLTSTFQARAHPVSGLSLPEAFATHRVFDLYERGPPHLR